MKKKGQARSDDLWEWLKIAIAIIVGYIIIKALLSAT